MRVLFTPYSGGSIAHVVRSLALADELRSRGHDVLFTSSFRKRRFISEAGFQVFGEGHPDVNLNDESDQTIGFLDRKRDDFLAWFRDEIAAAEAFRPDVVVNSPTFFGPVAAKKLGCPHVSLTNGNWHPDFRGVLGLGRCRLTPADAAARRLLRPLFARGFESKYLAHIRSWYADLGIRPPSSRREVHAAAPALVPGCPSLEPVEAGTAGVRYVGPLLWQGFEREPLRLPFGGSRKLVYLTLGGSAFSAEAYRTLISALLGAGGFDVLVSVGPNFDRGELPCDSERLAVRQYVPGLAACAAADVVVGTAGHGTVTQALLAGKPIVSVPRNIDQATFAARLSELGAGTNLNPVGVRGFAKREAYVAGASKVRPGRVAEAVREAATNRRMREASERIGNELRSYERPAAIAADSVELAAGGGGW